jgi:transcriptional regulator with XRE-family HTH domain
MGTDVSYDIAKMTRDMTAKGWLPADLAKRARVSKMTVSRFLNGLRSNPRTAAKLARALGHDADFYLVSAELQGAAR